MQKKGNSIPRSPPRLRGKRGRRGVGHLNIGRGLANILIDLVPRFPMRRAGRGVTVLRVFEQLHAMLITSE